MLSEKEILSLASQSLSLVLTGSLPSIAAAAISGVLISLIQALTQIQDQGLPTAVKFFAVLLVLFMTYLSTASSIAAFTTHLFAMIETI
ncbi:MAG: flagellar biosynthetic protein FliQ [Alphaproteobacteria bacterium]|nr:flagellar biosynthetic protein FliQ [Alphaproteobacteria bacterium]